MNVPPIQTNKPQPTFGITTVKPYKKFYSENSWNEISEGKFKDYSFTVYNNYSRGKANSSLVILKKLGHFLKSRVRYTDSRGQRQIIMYNK